MTKRVNFDDDGNEWIELNKQVNDAVTEIAMEENLRFGNALVAYVEEQYAEDDD